MITVADSIEYRRRTEKLVERTAKLGSRPRTASSRRSPTARRSTGRPHLALVHGDVDEAEDVLVRVHCECLTGDVFHSLAATAASSSIWR